MYGESLSHFVADLEECARSGALRREMDYVFLASGAERRMLVSYTPLDPDLVVVATRDVTEFWERAREERQRVAELEQLAALTQSLVECEDSQQSRDTLCDAARRLVAADAVYLMEAEGEVLLQTAAATAGGVPAHEPIRQPLAGPSVGVEAYRTRERLFIPDVCADPRSSPLAYERSGMQSGFFQPVVVGERVLGVLVVAWGHPLPASPAARDAPHAGAGQPGGAPSSSAPTASPP